MHMAAHAQTPHPDHVAAIPPIPSTPQTLTASAVYQLSEAGRKASLLMGGDGLGWQRLSIQVPTTRMHLVAVDMQGIARLRLQPRFERARDERVTRRESPPVYDTPPTIDELFRDAARNHELERAYEQQRLAPQVRRREAEQARRSQIATEFLADPGKRAKTHPRPTDTSCVIATPSGALVFDARTDIGPARDLIAEAYRRFQADYRIQRAEGLARRAEEIAICDARKRAIDDWIAFAGTSDQRARHAAGLLSQGEVIAGLTDDAFAALATQPRYKPVGVEAFQAYLRTVTGRADLVVAPMDLKVTGTPAASATAEQWAVVEHLQAAMPDAVVTLRDHRLSWRREPELPAFTHQGALVVRRVGPFLLRREFAVPAR